MKDIKYVVSEKVEFQHAARSVLFAVFGMQRS